MYIGRGLSRTFRNPRSSLFFSQLLHHLMSPSSTDFLQNMCHIVPTVDHEIWFAFPRPSKLQSILTFTPSSLAKTRTKPGFCWNQRLACTASMPGCTSFSARGPVSIPPTAVIHSLSPTAFLTSLAKCTW